MATLHSRHLPPGGALVDAGQVGLLVAPNLREDLLAAHGADQIADPADAYSHGLGLDIADADALAPAQADPDRVAQVLLNLLVNALRHTPAGGSVSVSAAPTTEAVEIAVADTGEGIAAEDLPHVFERFWRADPARARSKAGGEERLADGTGLGLAVAQSLVEAQGGRIWAESTPGEGTVFRFTLPFAECDRGTDSGRNANGA